uniref:Uncharacterized protein n=2 Tax=Knipowitschia caucasica TaxID=637954 RepID=A0AAV2KBU0_KNICA
MWGGHGGDTAAIRGDTGVRSGDTGEKLGMVLHGRARTRLRESGPRLAVRSLRSVSRAVSTCVTMTMQFEFPKIDWEAADLYQEFQRFRSHVGFVFAGPLSARENKEKAGWIAEVSCIGVQANISATALQLPTSHVTSHLMKSPGVNHQ